MKSHRLVLFANLPSKKTDVIVKMAKPSLLTILSRDQIQECLNFQKSRVKSNTPNVVLMKNVEK